MKKFLLYCIIGAMTFLIGYYVDDQYGAWRSPVQPINFSHKIHAGDNKIPCMYCHIFADRSRAATVPNVQRCMGCHKIIKTDSPLIQQLTTYWDKKEPIPWIKVHNLPDYVYFPHKRHIRAGLDCKLCHGNVPAMARIRRVAPLQMGWCINCHQKHKVKNGWDCYTCHQ